MSQIKTLQEDTGLTPCLDQVETPITGANKFKGIKLPNSPQIISSFQKGYKDFLANILVQIEKCYPESAVETLQALSVLGLRRLNGMSEEDVGKLGKDEIAMLSQKNRQRDEPYIEASETHQELAMLKTLVRSQHYPTESLPVLWNIINTHHRICFQTC